MIWTLRQALANSNITHTIVTALGSIALVNIGVNQFNQPNSSPIHLKLVFYSLSLDT